MEVRAIAEGAFDLDRLLRRVAWIHVGFLRAQQRGRRVGVAAEDRLAPDDHELVLSDDLRRRRHDMLEVGPTHDYRISSRILRRSGSLRAPAKGEF